MSNADVTTITGVVTSFTECDDIARTVKYTLRSSDGQVHDLRIYNSSAVVNFLNMRGQPVPFGCYGTEVWATLRQKVIVATSEGKPINVGTIRYCGATVMVS